MSKRRAADKKHLRQSIRRNQRNRSYKSRVRTALKDFETITETEKIREALPKTISEIDRAASKKVFHKNKAARLKSRLAHKAAGEAAA